MKTQKKQVRLLLRMDKDGPRGDMGHATWLWFWDSLWGVKFLAPRQNSILRSIQIISYIFFLRQSTKSKKEYCWHWPTTFGMKRNIYEDLGVLLHFAYFSSFVWMTHSFIIKYRLNRFKWNLYWEVKMFRKISSSVTVMGVSKHSWIYDFAKNFKHNRWHLGFPVHQVVVAV